MLCILFFFSSRRLHTICALVTGVQTCALPISRRMEHLDNVNPNIARPATIFDVVPGAELEVLDLRSSSFDTNHEVKVLSVTIPAIPVFGDRKSVVSGKSVSVRVDTGGRSIIKKKKETTANNK